MSQLRFFWSHKRYVKMHHFYRQKFSDNGHSPSLDPSPVGMEYPLPRLHISIRGNAYKPARFGNHITNLRLKRSHVAPQHENPYIRMVRYWKRLNKMHATLELCVKLACLMYKALANTQPAYLYTLQHYYCCSNSFIIRIQLLGAYITQHRAYVLQFF